MCNVHIRDMSGSTWKRRCQSIELPRLRSKLIELGPNVIEQELKIVFVLRGTRVVDITGILPVDIDAFRRWHTEKNDVRLDEQRLTSKTKRKSPTIEIIFHDEIDAVLSKCRPRRGIGRHLRKGIAERPATKTRINLGPGRFDEMDQPLFVIVVIARLVRWAVPRATFHRPFARIPVVRPEQHDGICPGISAPYGSLGVGLEEGKVNWGMQRRKTVRERVRLMYKLRKNPAERNNVPLCTFVKSMLSGAALLFLSYHCHDLGGVEM